MLRPTFFLSSLLLLSLLLLSSPSVSAKRRSSPKPKSKLPTIDQAHYWCAVCETSIDEIDYAIRTTPESHTVQTRWRIDEKKRIPYARTEYRLLEIIEKEVAPKFYSYGLATYEDGSRPRLLKSPAAHLGTYKNFTDGGSIPESVRKMYEKLVEDFLDEIVLMFHREEGGVKEKFCVQLAKSCVPFTDFTPAKIPELIPPPPPPAPAEPAKPAAAAAEGEVEGGAPAAGGEALEPVVAAGEGGSGAGEPEAAVGGETGSSPEAVHEL